MAEGKAKGYELLRKVLTRLTPGKKKEKAHLTIDDFILHLMQLTYDLVQNFLRDKTWLQFSISMFRALQSGFYTHLLHPVKLRVGFAGAANGSHSDMKKIQETR